MSTRVEKRFEALDWGLKKFEGHWPKSMRARAINCAKNG
jgi:squalene-hopene/tetraprenyl-beta-curcumene cyclase